MSRNKKYICFYILDKVIMSVNRHSDLDTSLSRMDDVHYKYLNLSSANRDKNVDPESTDAELSFDTQSNVIGMKILNFEIPHTRYAIENSTSNLYISEKRGEDDYHFYSLRASSGGHSVQTLCVSLSLSSQCPVMFNSDRAMGNTYDFHTSLPYGKVAITSSGEYDFTIHAAMQTVTLSSIVVNSDTEANVSFLASQNNIFKPGALLVFQAYTYPDRDVQVVDTLDNHVRVIGDFSDIDGENLDVSLSHMVPYSGVKSVAKILGFGEADVSGQTDFEMLSIGSPFSGDGSFLSAEVMIATMSTAFVSSGEYVQLFGVPGFMNGMVCEVGEVHDDSHIEIYVDRSELWSHDSATLSNLDDPTVEWGVNDVVLVSVNDNEISLKISPSSATSLSVGDFVVFDGFHHEEFQDIVATVVSMDQGVTVQFDYPTSFLFKDGVTSLSPVNPTTALRTTYMASSRFDLSRGRRMVLCRAIVDNQDVGSIHIPALSTRAFFGRIQLFSGMDLVNFLNADTAVGSHEFNSVLKRLSKIRFQFFNEDGTSYNFVGVDYTMFLRLTCLDSNKGI